MHISLCLWLTSRSSGSGCSVTQSCPTLCEIMGWSPPGSSVHDISQARILEWVAFPFPGDLPNPGIEPASLMSPALADGFFTTSATTEAKEIDGCQRLGIEAGNDFKETWGHVLG